MNITMNTVSKTSDSGLLEGIQILLQDFLLPVLVAVLVYIVVERLGEWRKRRMFSRLGVVIIDSFLEELRTGIELMRTVLAAIDRNDPTGPPPGFLPNRTWNGMSTIPDDVLLRIVETSRNRTFDGFPPQQCRTHCKNYFTHMNDNYQLFLSQAIELHAQHADWRRQLQALLRGPGQPYLESALGVEHMLANARQLLDENSRRRFPK